MDALMGMTLVLLAALVFLGVIPFCGFLVQELWFNSDAPAWVQIGATAYLGFITIWMSGMMMAYLKDAFGS